METFRISFDRTFTADDCKQNIPFSVSVPAGTTHFQVNLSYDPPGVDGIRNLLTLTVFDPSGWRGEGHRGGNHKEVSIAADQATPGFQAGPVPAGTWQVVINTQMVMPGPACQVRLEVFGTDEPVENTPPAWKPGRTASRGPGWYRGDLHAHSTHSDASWDVAGLTAYARAKGLDFITLSDHNTVTGLAEMDAACADDLLTLGGMELTTFHGHALALGLREWIDWRTFPGQHTMNDIAAEVARRGGLFVIAHPMADGDPKCTGCNWLYSETMPGSARVVEVWNTPWQTDSNNEDSLKLAYHWLNQGYRMALTAGTDNHGGRATQFEYGFNVVYADDLSEAEILRSVRAGRLYLSAGPVLGLEAAAGIERAGLGEALRPLSGDPVRLRAHWEACPADARLDWVVDGEVRQSAPAPDHGSTVLELAASPARWALVTLRNSQEKMLALTNPIYLDGRS